MIIKNQHKKKKTIFILMIISIALIGLLTKVIIFFNNKALKEKWHYISENRVIKCIPEVFTVLKVSDDFEAIEPVGKRKWKVLLAGNQNLDFQQEVFFITDSEHKYPIGTRALFATDCKLNQEPIKLENDERVYNIYYYNKENMQVELKSGIIRDKSIILNYK